MYAENYRAGNVDAQYFESYGNDIEVTKVMLRDKARMDFYESFLRSGTVKDKIVLDVGCGTGVLSMLAARGGAKRVIAIEASPMHRTAVEIIRGNELDHIITVLPMRAEDVTLKQLRKQGLLQPGEAIDYVVSEWMGFYLFHECMLPSVLSVRRAVAPTSVLFPARGSLWMAPISLQPLYQAKQRSWASLHPTLNFNALCQREWDQFLLNNPLIEMVPCDSLMAEGICLGSFDFASLTTSKLDEMEFQGSFSFPAEGPNQNGSSGTYPHTSVDAFVIWFVVEGNLDVETNEQEEHPTNSSSSRRVVQLDTSPLQPGTHWKHTIVRLPISIPLADLVEEEVLNVVVVMSQDKKNRTYDISVELG